MTIDTNVKVPSLTWAKILALLTAVPNVPDFPPNNKYAFSKAGLVTVVFTLIVRGVS
jgi:hypothetical protein